MPSHRTNAERERITVAVLEAPIEMSHGAVSKRVGLHRDTVRQIRYGIINSDVAVHLQRQQPGTFRQLCTGCVHFKRHAGQSHNQGDHVGECSLGFIEAEDLTYARGCAAFWADTKTK